MCYKKNIIGIVILNYNTWSDTINCINSIFKFYSREILTIYVVDNKSPIAPTQEQYTFLKKQVNIRLVFSTENKGYSAGNNIGIKIALEEGCERILICNSDVIFIDTSLLIMNKFLDNNINVGIVGPQIYDSNYVFQPIHMLSKLTAYGKIKYMCLHTPFRILFKKFNREFIEYEELKVPMKVFGVSGCCFLMSKECAELLYPLDERTFLYEEEYIIGTILEKSSLDVYVLPNTHIIHTQGGSTGKISCFSYKCLIDSEQIYLKDYLHTNFILRKIILIVRKVILFLHYKNKFLNLFNK